MAKRPYLFCRFEISLNGERLDAAGQAAFITENQGKRLPHSTRSDRPDATALIMEPERIESAPPALSFYVGYEPGYRSKTGYDSETQRRTTVVEQDDHIKSAHFVAIPRLGCLAIEDRTGDNNIPHSIATRAFRSIVRAALGDEADLSIIHLSDAEVRRVLTEWELTQYDYVVRPLNPIKLSDYNELRSEAMKADRVAIDAGRMRPLQGETMVANGGSISETQEMVDAGYGQSGGRAITPFGNEARIPKPAFHMDKAKNFAEREKPRFLKIIFDDDGAGNPDTAGIAATLVRFYGGDAT